MREIVAIRENDDKKQLNCLHSSVVCPILVLSLTRVNSGLLCLTLLLAFSFRGVGS
jgi:hypothetical protein